MRKLFAFISFVTIVVALCLMESCLAQITAPIADQMKPQPGNHDYIHLLNETINPQTGSVSIRIGVPDPDGRHLAAPFSFSYDSNSAHHGAGWQDNSGYLGTGGWSMLLPSLNFTWGAVTGPWGPGQGPGEGPFIGCNFYTGYMFEDAAGTTHALKLTNLDTPSTSNNNDCYYVQYWMQEYLTGGDASVSAFTTPLTFAKDTPHPVTVSDNDGNVYYFSNSHLHTCPGDNSGLLCPGNSYTELPDWVKDRNGNTVTYNDNGTGSITITDTLGRAAISINGFGSNGSGVGSQVAVSGLGTYTITWAQQPYNQTYNVQRIPPPEPSASPYIACAGAGFYYSPGTITALSSSTTAPPGGQPNLPLQVISKITLPNGQFYAFEYDPVYGLLSKVTYPDGAYSRYVWTINPLASADISGTRNATNTNAAAPCELIYDEPAIAQKFTSFDGNSSHEYLEQDYTYTPTTWASSGEWSYQRWTAKQTSVVTTDHQTGNSFKTVYNYVPVPVDPTGITDTLQQRQAGVTPVNPAETSILSYDATGHLLKAVTKSYADYWAEPNDEKTTLDNGQTSEERRCYLGSQGFLTAPWCSQATGALIGGGSILTDIWAYDYGASTGSASNPGAPGSLLLHKHADYNLFQSPLYSQGATIYRTKDIISYDGSNNRVAESDFCFDGDTTAFSGCAPTAAMQPLSAVQHDDTNFPNSYVSGRGNVTTAIARCFAGTSACAQGDAISKYTWDETGQMLSKTDARGNTTHYSFTDSFDITPGSTPATYSAASATIGGSEQYMLVGAQNVQLWDAGSVTIVINGQAFSTSYGQSSTAYTVTQALVGAINGSSSYVTATQSSNVINLQAKQTGGYQYPLSVSVTSSQNFTPPSFSPAASGPLVTGGTGSVGIGNTNAYLTGITDALNHTASYQYAFSDGQLIQATGENSEKSNFYYNDPLRRLTEADAPDGGQSLKTYNEASYPPNIVTQKSLDSSRKVTSTAILDGSTHVTQAQLNSDPQGMSQAVTTYDGLGRAYAATNAFRSTTDPTYSSTTQFDALGRVVTLTRQDYSTVTTAYSGPTTTVTDEAGNQRRSVTNALGQLVEVDEPGDNYPATPAIAAPTPQVTGTLRSLSGVGGTQATYATGSITLSGGEQCNQQLGCEQGSVNVNVGSFSTSVSYGSGSTLSGIVSTLVNQLNASAVVSATPNGTTINLTSKAIGSAGNYSLSASSTGGGAWPGPAFTAVASGAALTGGKNATGGTTVYDYGNVTVSVGSWTSAAAPYGQGGANAGNNTAPLVAQALLNVLNVSGSPVTAEVVNGNGLVITCKTLGTACNGDSVTISSSTLYTQYFTGGSFSGAATMMGGGGNFEASSLAIPFVTLYKYDSLGNLLCVEQHGDATNGTGCSSYPTPTAGDPWRTRMFTYDSLGHLLTAYNPETGTITYTYDANGNVVTKTDARGITINYSPSDSPIDALNRVTKETFSNGDPAITYSYDQGPVGTYPIGHRTGMNDASGSTSWTYDIMGHVASETRTINPGPGLNAVIRTISYQYDLAGNPTKITYPDGTVLQYVEDNAGRGLSATDTTHGINYIANASYAPSGGIASFTEGAGTTTITNSFFYNPRLQVCREMASTVGVTPQSCTDASDIGNLMDFQYDFHVGNADNGNLYTAANNKDASRTQAYTYDTLNRLLAAQTQGTKNSQGNIDCTIMVPGSTTQTKYWGESFGYDAWGNLTSKTTTLCTAENATLTVDALNKNRLLAAQYDASGNMTSNGGATYTYNGDGEMVSAGGYTYLYDGDGNRVAKTNGSSGTLYWYGAPGIVLETDLLGNAQSEYIFFGGSRIARRDVSGVSSPVYYYFANQIHSTALITDANGNVEDDADYYPWGGTLQFNSSLANHYWFSGKERDAETGLDYFGARYYGNTFGRFTQPDWSAKAVGVPYADFNNPHCLNLYGYVCDNPIIKVDPDGHFDCTGANAQGAGCQQQAAWRAKFGIPDSSNFPTFSVGLGEGQNNLSLHYSSAPQVGTDQNGNQTISTAVATATFSTKKGEEGKFLGFDESTVTTTKDKDTGKVTSTTAHVASGGLKEANAFFGSDRVSDAVTAAAQIRTPGVGTFLKQDHHAVVQGGSTVGGLGVGLFCLAAPPCGAAAGIAGTAFGVVGGIDWVGERFHWW